ncbi:hypothetical protein DFJ74DRAFT_477449 [Hyaloraphidium curvatum]|nr:hypothetical protein DFJ74DRAFT_477449 [Hyaloraphidium curvatum]
MVRTSAFVVLALCALLLLGPPPLANALPAAAEVDGQETELSGVVFRRSCVECGVQDFCEFAFPGAPDGQVACVDQSKRSSIQNLYRRYAPSGAAMVVIAGNAPVTDGGTADLGAAGLFRTITVSNSGDATLTLATVSVTKLNMFGSPSFPTEIPPAGQVLYSMATFTSSVTVTATVSISAANGATPTMTFTALATYA